MSARLSWFSMAAFSVPMRLLALPVVTIALLLGSCDTRLVHYRDYQGDGTFTPRPAPWICQDGYTVDLGSVDLTVAGEVTHRLDGLPPIEATVGLALGRKKTTDGASGHTADLDRLSALIQVTLRDDQDRIVFSRHERLSEWTASFGRDDPDHVYLYRRGTQVEVPVAPGTVRVERFPIGQDDSWGSYFVPRRGAHYLLHFAVEEPETDGGGIDARLQVNGVVGCL
jgi:hypothetical protein